MSDADLLRKRFIILGGKGGVGRTTVGAALASALARRGQRVLLAQTNAKERLSHLYGVPQVGPDIVRVRERLWAVNMTPTAALREYGLMVLRYEAVYKAVFENKVTRYFIHAIPGLDQYSMLGKAWYHTTEELEAGEWRYDTVILDGPATGHLVAMLRIPGTILAAVPEGPLTRDARLAQELLTDPDRTTMLLVTIAEDLPANEALDLYRIAREQLRVPVTRLIVNQVWSDRFTRSDGAAARVLAALADTEATADATLGPLLRRAETTRQRRLLNEHYLGKLAESLPCPQVQLPFVFAPDFGAAEVEMLSRLLEEELLP